MDFLITLLNILCATIAALLSVLELAFFLRAILSFIHPEEEGFFAGVLYMLTEPVILPIRALLAALHVSENTPFDIAFFIAFILLSAISVMLPAIPL